MKLEKGESRRTPAFLCNLSSRTLSQERTAMEAGDLLLTAPLVRVRPAQLPLNSITI